MLIFAPGIVPAAAERSVKRAVKRAESGRKAGGEAGGEASGARNITSGIPGSHNAASGIRGSPRHVFDKSERISRLPIFHRLFVYASAWEGDG